MLKRIHHVGVVVANLVAMLLRGHDEFAKVRVEVTAPTDAAARAEALKAALVAQGVDAKRLYAVGITAAFNKVDFTVEAKTEAKAAPAAPAPAP